MSPAAPAGSVNVVDARTCNAASVHTDSDGNDTASTHSIEDDTAAGKAQDSEDSDDGLSVFSLGSAHSADKQEPAAALLRAAWWVVAANALLLLAAASGLFAYVLCTKGGLSVKHRVGQLMFTDRVHTAVHKRNHGLPRDSWALLRAYGVNTDSCTRMSIFRDSDLSDDNFAAELQRDQFSPDIQSFDLANDHKLSDQHPPLTGDSHPPGSLTSTDPEVDGPDYALDNQRVNSRSGFSTGSGQHKPSSETLAHTDFSTQRLKGSVSGNGGLGDINQTGSFVSSTAVIPQTPTQQSTRRAPKVGILSYNVPQGSDQTGFGPDDMVEIFIGRKYSRQLEKVHKTSYTSNLLIQSDQSTPANILTEKGETGSSTEQCQVESQDDATLEISNVPRPKRIKPCITEEQLETTPQTSVKEATESQSAKLMTKIEAPLINENNLCNIAKLAFKDITPLEEAFHEIINETLAMFKPSLTEEEASQLLNADLSKDFMKKIKVLLAEINTIDTELKENWAKTIMTLQSFDSSCSNQLELAEEKLEKVRYKYKTKNHCLLLKQVDEQTIRKDLIKACEIQHRIEKENFIMDSENEIERVNAMLTGLTTLHITQPYSSATSEHERNMQMKIEQAETHLKELRAAYETDLKSMNDRHASELHKLRNEYKEWKANCSKQFETLEAKRQHGIQEAYFSLVKWLHNEVAQITTALIALSKSASTGTTKLYA